jgi:hypothetical protein
MSVRTWRVVISAAIVFVCALTAEGRFQVNQYDRHEQTSPAVATTPSGDFVVVWRSHVSDGRGGGVYARRYFANGAAATDEFKVNVTDVDLDTWTPAVAMNPSGGFVIAWTAARAGDSDVVARMYDSAGKALTGELPVSQAPDAAQSSPAISMNAAGSFVVVWSALYGDTVHGRSYVCGRVFNSDGTPKTEEFRVNGLAQEDWPAVAMDGQGQFIVSWIRMGDTYNRPFGEYIMYRQFFGDGSPAGGAIALTGDLNSRWYGPAVAAGAQGDFVVTWAVGPFPYDIFAQGFSSGGLPTTLPYKVNTSTAGNQGHPTIAADGTGRFLIAWDSQSLDGTCCGVSAQPCTCSGQLQGAEVEICCPQAQRQWYPRVALADGGKYVMVWTGQTADGTYDIFGEIDSAK